MLPPTDHTYGQYRPSAETKLSNSYEECLNLSSEWSPTSSHWYPMPDAKRNTTAQPRCMPPLVARPKLTTTVWEDEGTLCYQVDAKSVCVARRQDNDMINGTKLLNVVGMSRGKRDGILKNERGRVVVKVGAMHLKGVWIPFTCAKDLATKFKIVDILYPLFVDDPSLFLTVPPMSVPGSHTLPMMTVPRNDDNNKNNSSSSSSSHSSFGSFNMQSWEKNNTYQPLPSITNQQDQLFVRSTTTTTNQHHGSCSPIPNGNNELMSYTSPYHMYSNNPINHVDHRFSPYSSFIQQRKLSYPIMNHKEDTQHFDERRHSIHFPSSPPPESTNMKFAFSSPMHTSHWTEGKPTTPMPDQFIRQDVVMIAGRHPNKEQKEKGKKRSRSPLQQPHNIKHIKTEHDL